MRLSRMVGETMTTGTIEPGTWLKKPKPLGWNAVHKCRGCGLKGLHEDMVFIWQNWWCMDCNRASAYGRPSKSRIYKLAAIGLAIAVIGGIAAYGIHVLLVVRRIWAR